MTFRLLAKRLCGFPDGRGRYELRHPIHQEEEVQAQERHHIRFNEQVFPLSTSPLLNESDQAKLGGHAEGTPTCIWTRVRTELCLKSPCPMSRRTTRWRADNHKSRGKSCKLDVACCSAAKWSALENNVGQLR